MLLVVDDNEHWLETIKSILDPPYDLDLFTDPEEAKTALKANRYSLVILDKNLPGVSGLTVLSEMRKIAPDLRAIILTGYADVESAVESMKLGALDYISKGNLDLTKLLRLRVKEALAREVPSSASQPSIVNLISGGESTVLEFKSSVRWDYREHKVNRSLEKLVVRTVASFLNSDHKSSLLLGVSDDGDVIGLEQDYLATGRKQGRDSYENSLMTLFIDSYGREIGPFIQIAFHTLDGKDICQVMVSPASKPVFVREGREEQFFVRIGNSTRLLSTREAIEYCKNRWK